MNFSKFLKRALHYPINWIRFLEINNLCNVIAKNLAFSTNWKLISISWKVLTCSNFSTDWKLKWNESYSVLKEKRGRKTEIWVNLKQYISINQISSHVIKTASKKARFLAKQSNELWREEESLWNILSDNYKIRQEKEKKCGRMSRKLEMTVINHFFKMFLWILLLWIRGIAVSEAYPELIQTSKMKLFVRIANCF